MAENTTPTVYVICDQNCKFESMTKEQILAAIMQAVNEGTISNIDAGFITKIKTVNNRTLRFFVGEKSQYDALSEKDKENLFAIITNDTTKEALLEALEALLEFKDGALDGSVMIAKAAEAEQLKLKSHENAYFSKKLEEVEQLSSEGLYYMQVERKDGSGVRSLGAFFFERRGAKVYYFLDGYDDENSTVPKLKIFINGDGTFTIYNAVNDQNVTENYTMRVAKLGG